MDNSHCKNGGLCDIDGNCKCRKFDPEITGVHCEGMQLKNANSGHTKARPYTYNFVLF